jgi:hypothetical protein
MVKARNAILEIQLSGGGWDPINRFNPTTHLCLSQVKIWISKTICRGFFLLFYVFND